MRVICCYLPSAAPRRDGIIEAGGSLDVVRLRRCVATPGITQIAGCHGCLTALA